MPVRLSEQELDEDMLDNSREANASWLGSGLMFKHNSQTFEWLAKKILFYGQSPSKKSFNIRSIAASGAGAR